MLALETVEAVFRRLSTRYGSAWTAKWAGLPVDDVKADWAKSLGLCSKESILYALEYLPEFVPTVGQFREICNRAPAPKLAAIEAPADPEARARGIERLRSLQIGDADPRAWIRRLIERQDRGEKLSVGQVHCLTEALKNLGLSSGAATAIETDAVRTDRLRRKSLEGQTA